MDFIKKRLAATASHICH